MIRTKFEFVRILLTIVTLYLVSIVLCFKSIMLMLGGNFVAFSFIGLGAALLIRHATDELLLFQAENEYYLSVKSKGGGVR